MSPSWLQSTDVVVVETKHGTEAQWEVELGAMEVRRSDRLRQRRRLDDVPLGFESD